MKALTLVRLGTGRIHSTLSWKITVDSLVSLWTKVNNPASSLPLLPSTGLLWNDFHYLVVEVHPLNEQRRRWPTNFKFQEDYCFLVVHTRLSIAQNHNVPPMGVASQCSSLRRNNFYKLACTIIYCMLQQQQKTILIPPPLIFLPNPCLKFAFFAIFVVRSKGCYKKMDLLPD